MKSIGDFLSEARLEQNLNLDELEKRTKIKKEFIDFIEKGSWDNLPEFPIVQGFVKSIASILEVDSNQAVAYLKRDYPPKKLPITPKPDVDKKFVWTPKLTFLAGISVVMIAAAAYLILQYINFIRPPKLLVTSPAPGEIIMQNPYRVEGQTDPDVTVVVNNQTILVDENGNFSEEIEISEDINEFVFSATSRSGKVATQTISVETDFEQ